MLSKGGILRGETVPPYRRGKPPCGRKENSEALEGNPAYRQAGIRVSF